MSSEILIAFFSALGAGIIVWLYLKSSKQPSSRDFIDEIQQHVFDRLDKVTDQVDRRLQENVHAMNDSKTFLANRVSATERSVRDVSNTLSKLEHATSSLKVATDEITSFQNLLKSPKVRGSFGEVMLENLLADVLPHDRYDVQHTLRSSGEIADAIIRLQDGYIVAIDAKFPLANYEMYAKETEPTRQSQLRTQVRRDIKKHVTDISNKYIAPQEKTLDYAFMYIPVEGVYYETMVNNTPDATITTNGKSLWDFCLEQHVVPVSPNSFLAYLHTVLVGLRGMRIEQQAREILSYLSQVRHDFKRFSDDYSMIGRHLTNAKNRFDDSSRHLDKFQNRLEQIEKIQATPTIPDEADRLPVE